MAYSFSVYYFVSLETVCPYLHFSFKGLIVSFGLMLQVLVRPMLTWLKTNKRPYISLASPKPPNLPMLTYKCNFNTNTNKKLQYKPLGSA